MSIKSTRLAQAIKPLLSWYDLNARKLPWRETRDPYCIWVSEIMLQQTRVETVKPYYERFIKQIPDISALARISWEELSKLWEGLGYYSRVRNMQKAARMICDDFAGVFPCDYASIRKLPGIGSYTAGAIASIAFDLPFPAVDGNVLRVIARLMADDRDILLPQVRKEVEETLKDVYPKQRCGDFTQSLMELGALICVPGAAPKCEICPLAFMCEANKNNTQADYPIRRKKAEKKKQTITVVLLQQDSHFALRKRNENGLLKGLWEPINFEGEFSRPEIEEKLQNMGVTVKKIERLPDQKHIFTHIEWKMKVYAAECSTKADNLLFVWADREELDCKYTLPTAFSKLFIGK